MIVTKTKPTGKPATLLYSHLAIQGSILVNQGTMGCCLILNERTYGMTNYHVLFGKHTQGYVQKYIFEKLDVYSVPKENGRIIGRATHVFNLLLDYALFEVTPGFDYTELSTLGEPTEPRIGMCLYKVGATTGLTYGIVDESSRLDQSVVILRTTHKNPSEKLCDYGDSGSLWLYDDGSSHHRPVALHIGTSMHDHRMGRAHTFSALLRDIYLHAL